MVYWSTIRTEGKIAKRFSYSREEALHVMVMTKENK